MAAALLPPASTTRRGVNPSAFMGSSFAAGSNLADKVAGNTKDIVVLKGTIIKLQKDNEEKEDKSGDRNLADRLDNIAQSLGVLTRILKADLTANKVQAQKEEKDRVRTQRRERETGLERKRGVFSGVTKTVTKPFRGFFDHIFNFFKQILLGSALLGLVKWLKDPANQDKIAAFSKFMTKTLPEVIGKVINHMKKNWKIYAVIAGALVLLNFAGIIAGLKVVVKVLAAIGGFLFSMKGLLAVLTGLALWGGWKIGKPRFDAITETDETKRKFLNEAPSTKNLSPGDKEAIIQGSRIPDAGGPGSLNIRNPFIGGSAIQGDYDSPMGGFNKLADGGRPVVGKVALVGERGPELFIPDVPGTVVPNHMIGKNLKSSSIDRPMIPNKTQFIDLSGGQSQQQTGNATEGGSDSPSFSSRSGDGSLASMTELGVLNA